MQLLEYFATRIAGVIGGQFSLTTPLDPAGGPAVTYGQLDDVFPVGIAITPYVVDAETFENSNTDGLQLYYRGTFSQVMDMREQIFNDLQGLSGIQVSDTLVIEAVNRRSGTSLGYDTNHRLNWSDNYYVRNWAPTANRL